MPSRQRNKSARIVLGESSILSRLYIIYEENASEQYSAKLSAISDAAGTDRSATYSQASLILEREYEREQALLQQSLFWQV